MSRERKVRFGISVPESLARRLNSLAKAMGADRSKVVNDALREYIHDHIHYLVPHECKGVMVFIGRADRANILSVLDDFNDIVKCYSRINSEGVCIDTIIVSGNSKRIVELHRTLGETFKCSIRYVPVAYDIEEEGKVTGCLEERSQVV